MSETIVSPLRPSTLPMFPLVSWNRIENAEADAALTLWNHYLGPCNRPFGKMSFGLFVHGELVSVAVAATVVKNSIYGYPRKSVTELARCCSAPNRRQFTRVTVRLFRETVIPEWYREYWPVSAILSYSRKDKHLGDIYRFDGWKLHMETRASRVGPGSHHSTAGREIPAKKLWVWDVHDKEARSAA